MYMKILFLKKVLDERTPSLVNDTSKSEMLDTEHISEESGCGYKPVNFMCKIHFILNHPSPFDV